MYIKVILALIVVLCIISACALLLNYMKRSKLLSILQLPRRGAKLVTVKDLLILDSKRRISLIAYNGKEYLLLLGNKDKILDIISKDTDESHLVDHIKE